jgi:hypothetical protein
MANADRQTAARTRPRWEADGFMAKAPGVVKLTASTLGSLADLVDAVNMCG